MNRRKLGALVCALALLCALALPVRSAASPVTIYLLAVNDKFCDLPGGALPISSGGAVYIPYTAFDRSITGVDLGVYYGIDQSRGTVLTLYSTESRLSFIMSDGTCEDAQGDMLSFRALSRNGVIYVPASAVCWYFGLQYSMISTEDRGTLIRVSNRRAHLSNSDFLANSVSTMTYRYNQILRSMAPAETPQPTATPVPAPPAPVATTQPNASKERVRVYLAVDASNMTGDVAAAIPGQVTAVVFFAPDTLSENAAAVRKVVAAGHSVGFKVTGTAEEVAGQLERGNELLAHIARTRTRIVSPPAGTADQLSQEGWVCWSGNTTGSTANAILSSLDAKRTVGYVTLPGNAGVIDRVVSQVRREGYDVRRAVETEL